MALDHDLTEALRLRQRALTIGTPEAFAHTCTDEALARLLIDPEFLTYERAGNGGWWAEDALDGAAVRELAWRKENGIYFGWSRR